MSFQSFLVLLKKTLNGWSEDRVSSLAAALAYYTIFSVGPILIIAIAIAGLIFGRDAVQGQLLSKISDIFGAGSAIQIKTMIVSAYNPETSLLAQAVAVIILLFGASGVFGELQTGLNAIWGVEPKPGRGIMGIIKDRFFSFTMVLGIGFLLLVSLILSVVLSMISSYTSHLLPAGEFIAWIINSIISLLGITCLFALIFKILPDVNVFWRDVWLGAFVTSLLFTLGKYLLGIYLVNVNVQDGFGAAGSLIIVLVWVYYSAQILFIGAEFTKAFATRNGRTIKPYPEAILVNKCKEEE
ncbi:YihY/virulence factor BrkB family protein [Legionella jordanis]|uniref:Ribonuclease BN n=1 Tax=Legionella jordanis TaxID=456 RepID=A0A0W0VA68_9GAMM|nr:YihY/virulence factor BrkB family protein [Legionella jordanis]KTD17035.1 ribonuclease BN [Legionella jordanis]RMX03173.1 YihY/virulence factor BrkB family protein [Legionella jordanis]RMX18688.1 YihY/virulence factor BrkB family protein [Legionella jordanis]VEH12769.1 ribonuclease BN [Legionella jordanis]